MRRNLALLLFSSAFAAPLAHGQTFLFDATKAEMAANADWVIDADVHNIGNVSSVMTAGAGSESNPQQTPTPAASGITSGTSETYWEGALSAWGVALVKQGKSVQTLPFNGSITYGNNSNAQDLSHYKVFVVDEPNTSFSAAEKTAIYSFIKAGGSLFAVSDHINSDRNSDGIDSVGVWNDFLSADGAKSNPLGMTVNAVDISPNSFTVDTKLTDPVTHGSAGTVSEFKFVDGASITIDPTANSSVTAAVWEQAPATNANALVAYGTYGLGKFVLITDSSPIDDGTGDPNDNLFDGWDDAAGNDGKLVMNASLYLAPAPEPSTALLAGSIGMFALRRRRA